MHAVFFVSEIYSKYGANKIKYRSESKPIKPFVLQDFLYLKELIFPKIII